MLLQTQFLLINGHFTLNLLAALVCFAVAWLYYDAWLGSKNYREGTKALGFLLLSLSFVVSSTVVEQTLLETSLIGAATQELLITAFKISGYLTLIIGQLIDPLQPLPDYRLRPSSAILITSASIPLEHLAGFAFPILAVYTAFLYLNRATKGLEHHLKPIAASFFFLSFSELAGRAVAFRATDNVFLSSLVAPFGPIWILENILIIIFFLVLGRWVWGYLVKRLETELLMIFTSVTLVVFLITTIFFTTTSMANLRTGTLNNLKINVNVLGYSIDSKKAESLSDAQVITQNPEVVSAVAQKDRTRLKELTTNILLAKKQTFLVVVSATGEILVRAEDPDKIGGSLSDDPLVKKALSGEEATGVVTREGALAPEVSVMAASPVKSSEGVIGAVLVGTAIDNAFVDGLKNATSLDASIYADNVRSATTFVAPDGKSRWVGIKEETDEVKKTVLVDGEIFTGTVNVLNTPYFAAFAPLNDVSGSVNGMLFVGQPQVFLLQAASQSIELTFLVTVGLLVMSVFPAYFISKYIVDQIR